KENIRLLEILIVNDSNDRKISPKVAQGIVSNKDILGVIGHNSSNATKAALKVYRKEKLPVISSTSTSTELKSEVFFRTVINNSVMAKRLAEYVQEQSKQKVVIFYNKESSYSEDMKKHFAQELGDFIEVENIDLKKTIDINEEINSVVSSQFKAGMLFSDVNSETIALVIKIATANNELSENQRLSLFGGDSLYNCGTLKESQQEFIGLILAVPWHKDLKIAEPFLDRAKAQWTGPVGWRTATSYDATKAFIYALSKSGDNPTRSTVLKKLKEVNLPSNETSGQNLRFNSEGETTGKAILVEVFESPNRFCSDLDFRLVEEYGYFSYQLSLV
ncbi:MAG: ABC transporter substrate-binding protein, partial [Okeania sp. SIO3C4]|nr:ABC transporter substrate-binding protein [Okeania sp. SIO3C4]